MQMVKNILVLLFVLPFLVLFFMPKKEFYYLLEKRLFAQDIVISGETLQENFLGLTVKHPTFYLDGAPIAIAKEISMWSMFLYTRVDLSGLRIAQGLPTELSTDEIYATHSILSPLKIDLAGKSSLGTVQGDFRLKTHIIYLNIAKDGVIGGFSDYLEKSEKGWVYESKF